LDIQNENKKNNLEKSEGVEAEPWKHRGIKNLQLNKRKARLMYLYTQKCPFFRGMNEKTIAITLFE